MEEFDLTKIPCEKKKLIKDKKYASNTASSKKDKVKGLLYTFSLTLSVGASNVCVPLLERKIPDFELNSIRCTISLLLMTVILIFKKQLPKVPKTEWLGMAGFSIIGFITALTGYTAVSLIPLSYHKSLLFTSSIVTGLIIFPKFLNEKTDFKSVLTALLCIIGVILSIQPEFIFHKKKKSISLSLEDEYGKSVNSTTGYNISFFNENHTNSSSNNNEDLLSRITYTFNKTILGCIFVSIAGIGDAFHIVLLKRNPFLADSKFVTLFWMLLLCDCLSLVTMAIFEEPVFPKTWKQILLITCHSLSFVAVFYSLMQASKYISGNVINIIYSTAVIIMLIPQYTILKHILPGNRNWIEVLGTILVFIGATIGSIIEIFTSSQQ